MNGFDERAILRSASRSAVLLLMAIGNLAMAAPPIQAFESNSLKHIVESQQGRPFVVVVWSLDCVYCQTSLKNLSEENSRRRGRTLNVVTISTDSSSDPDAVAMMRQRLESLGLAGNAWAFGNAPAEQLRYALDPKWHGEKPRSYWFNAAGDKIAYSGVITSRTIARWGAK
ncbi:redoxin domain-containing protein [Noviherbaspirillum aerium]|uniref:redoxin domain-containing protein n=1 Tax=Noviherbaspirillum aerium TaxID=2588497 RepID=UPI00178C2DA5|nr:redoxin domain-containing protein [Noviherbaspirillum aerium]